MRPLSAPSPLDLSLPMPAAFGGPEKSASVTWHLHSAAKQARARSAELVPHNIRLVAVLVGVGACRPGVELLSSSACPPTSLQAAPHNVLSPEHTLAYVLACIQPRTISTTLIN